MRCQHTMLQKNSLILGLLLFCHSTRSAPSLQCTRDIAAYIAGITLDPKLWALKSEFPHKATKLRSKLFCPSIMQCSIHQQNFHLTGCCRDLSSCSSANTISVWPQGDLMMTMECPDSRASIADYCWASKQKETTQIQKASCS
jgi:hypothetical protein